MYSLYRTPGKEGSYQERDWGLIFIVSKDIAKKEEIQKKKDEKR